MSTKTRILNILKSPVSLAPMAGITDFVLRNLIRTYSSNCLLTTEMISSEFLAQNRNQDAILRQSENEHPLSYQINGHKPQLLYLAAKKLSPLADIIDINMGCPVNKVVKGQDGAALMRNPQLAYDLVQATIEGTDKPVSVKFRLGYTQDEMNYVEFGQKMQDAGAEFITIHARTRSQFYSGSADWGKVKNLKGNVDIPVFVNGDIVDEDSALRAIEESHADGVAIGRGVLGDPSLIHRVEHFLSTGERLQPPSVKEKINILKLHLKNEIEFRGEKVAIKFFRKFYPYYISGIPNASKYRSVIVTEENYSKIIEYLNLIGG